MHVFLTGEIQCGKSTVIDRILETTDCKVFGFRTHKNDSGDLFMHPADGSVAEYTDEYRIACRIPGSMRPLTDAFCRLGALYLPEELKEQNISVSSLIIMDEIGWLERDALSFRDGVLRILDGKVPVLGVIRKGFPGWSRLIPEHPGVTVITVTEENRDLLPDLIPYILRDELDLGAVVMASGHSVRFGQDKLSYPIEGISMLERVLGHIPPAFFTKRTLVARTPDKLTTGDACGFEAVLNNNVCGHRIEFGIGDLAKGFEEADVIVETQIKLPRQKQAQMETHCAVASYKANGTLEVISTTQTPHPTKMILAYALGLPEAKVHVKNPPHVGGGFGVRIGLSGKAEVLAAALSMKALKPVKITYTREEDFIASDTRHGGHLYCKLGATKDGKFVALDTTAILNTGAYCTFGVELLGVCGTCGTALTYDVRNMHYLGLPVYTNQQTAGAFQGFGTPQGTAVVEAAVDKMAHELGMDAQVLKADTAEEAMQIIHSGKIAFLSGLTGDLYSDIRPDVLVNCMNAGKEPDTRKEEVPVVIGAGPGYTAGVDCDAVIETKTGYDLGRVIYRGSSSDDSAAGSQGFADEKEKTAGKVSYKANAIAGGVLEAILFFTEELGRNK